MICSTINDQVIIKTSTGDKFVIPTAGVFVDVPTRDGTGGSMRRWFNMKELLLKNRVDPRTAADEASGALRLCHEWLDCPEKSLAIRTIKQFLDSKREERRDETLLIMAELYGRDIASKLSKGVREHQFFFPCYYLKEAGFAKIVVNLYKNFTGCASACYLSSEQQRVSTQSVRDVRWEQVCVLDAECFTDHETSRRSYQGSVRDCEIPGDF